MQIQTTSFKCDMSGCLNVTDSKGVNSYVQITQFAFYYNHRGNEIRPGGEKHFCCKDHFMKWVDQQVG